MSTSPSCAASGEIAFGVFERNADIGAVHLPGSASYDSETQAYTLNASGTDMWGDHDEFHFVWRQITGDFLLQAQLEFVGKGGDPHRKVGLIVRSSLDPRSPHVNACRHGNGMAALQYRRSEGTPTEGIPFEAKGSDILQIERIGETYTVSVAAHGQPFSQHQIRDVALGVNLYVGIYVCAHNNTHSEQAIVRNLRLVRPAKSNFVPYRDYIGSDLEVLDVSTGARRTLYHTIDSLQAPNWTPDGKTLVCNRNGRMLRFDLASRQAEWIDTGAQLGCNNDHALSFDGKWLGISSGTPSIVYTLPVGGGAPKQITPLGPSYLHGWSPDGKSLAFTGGRNGAYDIYLVPVDGGQERKLTAASGLDDGSEYTPDGKYIYYNSDRTGRMQIWRMRPDGSAQEQLTFDDFNNWFPHVSPTGDSVVFITYSSKIKSNDHPFYQHVYVRQIPLNGGAPKVIAYLYGGQGSMNVNSWSPDGHSLAFVSNGDLF